MNPFLNQFDDGHGSIDRLYEDPKFSKKVHDWCYRFSFEIFNGAYGPEDLFQDTYPKMKKCEKWLMRPGNVMSETEFNGWLFVLIRNLYFSQVRHFRNGGLLREGKTLEELDIPVFDDTEGAYLLSRFLRFIRRYPEARRNVIKLWLQDYTSREIKEKLEGTPDSRSHVTVGNWVNASLTAFKKSLGLELPATPPSAARTRRAGVGRSIAGQ